MARAITVRRLIDPQPGQYEHVDHNDEHGWHIWWQTVDRPGDVPYELYKPLWCPFQVGDIYALNDDEMIAVETVSAEHDVVWFWAVTGKAVTRG